MTDHEERRSERHLSLALERAGMAGVGVQRSTSITFQGRDLRIHFQDWGGSGPTLLFLHGGGLTSHTWDLVSLALTPTWRCIAMDLRGHGDSEWSANAAYQYTDYASDVAALADELGLERFGIVGQSLGGLTAVEYAASETDRVSAMCLVDVGPSLRANGTKRVGRFIAATAGEQSLEELVRQAIEFNPTRDPELLEVSLKHNLHQTASGKYVWKYDPRQFAEEARQTRSSRRAEMWAAVSTLEMPVLIVRGARSDIFLDEDAEALSNVLPSGSWHRIEGAGHNVQGDEPAALAAVLRQFFGAALTTPGP